MLPDIVFSVIEYYFFELIEELSELNIVELLHSEKHVRHLVVVDLVAITNMFVESIEVIRNAPAVKERLLEVERSAHDSRRSHQRSLHIHSPVIATRIRETEPTDSSD
jgi:hypothetical protein